MAIQSWRVRKRSDEKNEEGGVETGIGTFKAVSGISFQDTFAGKMALR